MSLLDIELDVAKRSLWLARDRMDRYRLAFGEGRVERDLVRRLDAALRRVRFLETQGAAALLVA
jgi:hypothetical protein